MNRPSKVSNFDVSPRRDQNILRFNISMNDLRVMASLQSTCNLINILGTSEEKKVSVNISYCLTIDIKKLLWLLKSAIFLGLKFPEKFSLGSILKHEKHPFVVNKICQHLQNIFMSVKIQSY